MCTTVLEKTGSVTTLSRYGHKDSDALICAAAKCKSSGGSDLFLPTLCHATHSNHSLFCSLIILVCATAGTQMKLKEKVSGRIITDLIWY